MTVRGADYPRRKNDDYPTPPEVVATLLNRVKLGPGIFDPACGRRNRITKVALRLGKHAFGKDITMGVDFLNGEFEIGPRIDVVTNPPFGSRGRLAVRFIERALALTRNTRARVAMLLAADFDSAKTRRHIFADCPQFALKLVLLDRIKWFNGESGSVNYAWYIWDWQHEGPPVIKYARIDEATTRRRRKRIPDAGCWA